MRRGPGATIFRWVRRIATDGKLLMARFAALRGHAERCKGGAEALAKLLLTSAEWLAAGAGTVDTDTDDGATDCNTNAPGAGVDGPVPTGSRSACSSTAGTFDQIGNGREVTLDLSTSVITGLPVADAEAQGGDWDDATAASLDFKLVMEDIELSGLDSEGVTARCGR